MTALGVAVAWGVASYLFWRTDPFVDPLQELRQTWLIGFGLSVAAGLVAALWFGLQEVLQHFYLRYALTRAGHMPWRYGDFLDHAADRVFLRRVGGGYIFVHRVVQEYFASAEPGEDPRPA